MIDKSKEYSYTGIPTFFKSDYGTIEQLGDYQIGVFGIPMDTGTSNRFGARLGPSAIRKASAWFNPNTVFRRGTVIDLYQRQRAIDLDHPEILDLGDVTIFPTDYLKSLESIERFSFEVAKRAFPVILGGDHSLTYPVVKGLVKGLQENKPYITPGIIHFDSHPDIWESYITLEHIWHGSPFRNLLDDGIIHGKHLIMIGDRSLLSTDEYAYIREHNISLYSISDIWEQGIVSILEEATHYLREQTDGVYISIDIDVFDPCYAPGTGTPAPGGLSPREMIQAINIICETTRLIGIDIVEVAPNYDPSESTQNLAAFLLHRFFQLYKNF
jgi:agmatinase